MRQEGHRRAHQNLTSPPAAPEPEDHSRYRRRCASSVSYAEWSSLKPAKTASSKDAGNKGLDTKLFPPPSGELAARRPTPEWREVHRELKRGRHVTLRLLWLEWREDHPEGWGYSQFCLHYQRWLGAQDVVMRLTYAAGERMFVDFAGDKATYTDPASGEVCSAEVFVAVLGASGMLYAEATRGQDLPSWVGAHIRAWAFYRRRGRGHRARLCPAGHNRA